MKDQLVLSLRKLALLTVCLLVVSVGVKAAAKSKSIEFACATQVYTTTFVGETIDGRLDVAVTNHNGPESMPIYNGYITSQDLPLLQQRSETFKKLGDHFTISFPLSTCTVYSPDIFSCHGGDTLTADGVKFKVLSLIVSKSTTKFQDVEYMRREVLIGFDVHDKATSIAMSYQPGECLFDLK